LCRAIDARRIVEIGTSYGVSTLYLAAGVRDNVRATGGSGVVIGTEYEPEKTRAARAHFSEAGLSSLHRSARGRSARDASSPRTTKLYDRTKERLTQDEVERIRL
jgi:predicted O-methyltransferase YrrM